MSTPDPNSKIPREGDSRAKDTIPAEACALAAGLLAEACRAKGSATQRARLTGELAMDLERKLESLARAFTEDSRADSLVESALAGADLATLAACNASALDEEGALQALASVHLAAGAVRATIILLETSSEEPGGDYAENLARDARGAAWRVDLAVRQANEAIEAHR